MISTSYQVLFGWSNQEEWNEVTYQVLVGKPEWKRPLGRIRRRWKDNIKMCLQEVRCGIMDWIAVAQDRDSESYRFSIVL